MSNNVPLLPGTVGLTHVSVYPFFGPLMLDCLHRTENAMTQTHAFKAAELCLIAQGHTVRHDGKGR